MFSFEGNNNCLLTWNNTNEEPMHWVLVTLACAAVSLLGRHVVVAAYEKGDNAEGCQNPNAIYLFQRIAQKKVQGKVSK